MNQPKNDLDLCPQCGWVTVNTICGRCERRAKNYLAAVCRAMVKVLAAWSDKNQPNESDVRAAFKSDPAKPDS